MTTAEAIENLIDEVGLSLEQRRDLADRNDRRPLQRAFDAVVEQLRNATTQPVPTTLQGNYETWPTEDKEAFWRLVKMLFAWRGWDQSGALGTVPHPRSGTVDDMASLFEKHGLGIEEYT